MLHRPDEFAAFVQEPPSIEIYGGVVMVRYRSGNIYSERAMSVRTFAVALERAQKALRMHAAGDEHVIVSD